MRPAGLLFALASIASACGGGDPVEPILAEDYASTFEEVRDCRRSIDHNFTNVRILASPEALAPYRDRDAEFPAGAVVVKEQYSENDDACDGPVIDFTVMAKLETGSSPDTIDWDWQQLDADGDVTEFDVMRCVSCHSSCGEPPEGYLGTCSAP